MLAPLDYLVGFWLLQNEMPVMDFLERGGSRLVGRVSGGSSVRRTHSRNKNNNLCIAVCASYVRNHSSSRREQINVFSLYDRENLPTLM
jgi:hypothetical protein